LILTKKPEEKFRKKKNFFFSVSFECRKEREREKAVKHTLTQVLRKVTTTSISGE